MTTTINYDALHDMVAKLENGGAFSLDDVREIFGEVFDEALQTEQENTL
jgi:hypothetical protein